MPKPPIAKPSSRATLRSLRQERKKLLAQRREMIFEMLIAGFRHDHIADRFGVSVKSLRREIDGMLDEREHAAPQRYVSLQLARLDKAMTKVSEALDGDNLAAVPLLFQVQAQYDRYEGFASRLANYRKQFPHGRVSAPMALNSLDVDREKGAGTQVSALTAEGDPEPQRGP